MHMKAYECIWANMMVYESYDSIWVKMVVNEFIWKSMKLYYGIWMYMKM